MSRYEMIIGQELQRQGALLGERARARADYARGLPSPHETDIALIESVDSLSAFTSLHGIEVE